MNRAGASANEREEARDAWPLPRTLLGHLKLETTRATVLYWLGVALVGGSVFISKILPCVDYGQHLALSDVARRLSDPSAPEHANFQLSYFTYNALFHFLVAKLSVVMPIELAGRSVVSLSLVLLGAGVVGLLRTLRRPPSYAALFTPIIFSFSVGWGFANYALGTAIFAIALVVVVRNLVRPSLTHALLLAGISLLCAFAHVLAMLLFCLMAAALAPEVSWRATAAREGSEGSNRRAAHAWRALKRTVLALAPILTGCIFCLRVYALEYAWDPKMYRDAKLEGTMPPLWRKLALFGAYATDLHTDRTDQVLMWAAPVLILAAGIVAWVASRRRAKGAVVTVSAQAADPGALILPLVVMVATYFATPMVFIGTHLIFPRTAQPLILAAVLAMPALAPAMVARFSRYALALGVIAPINLDLHVAMFAHETDDASRMLDDLPEHRRATAVVYDGNTFSFRNRTLVHLAADYAARKHGEWAFAFARYLSVPVRFRGPQPQYPLRGWEFTARDYNPRCKYARYYDLVVAKSPENGGDGLGDVAMRRLIFGQDADAVKVLSHHGKFWAFDTAGIPDDGTP